MPRKMRSLNRFHVCVKCRNGFANRRQFAYILDSLILLNLPVYLLVWSAASALGRFQPPSSLVVDILSLGNPVEFFAAWIFPLIFFCKDGFSGMSLGKWLMGVQVVDRTTREPAGFLASFKRNLILFVPIMPIVIAFTLVKGWRVGDRWANTIVIWRRHAHKLPFDPRGVRCTNCGYDLTGNISGRCPECFTPVALSAPSIVQAAASDGAM